MGKYGLGLIALVMAVLLAAGPLPSQAQATPGGAALHAGEGAAAPGGNDGGNSGEAGAEEATADDDAAETAEADEPADGDVTEERDDGADESDAVSEATESEAMDAETAEAAPAAAAETPDAAEAGEVPPAAGAAGSDIPANAPASAEPARARDPVTGADDPLEYDPESVGEGKNGNGARDPLEGMNRFFFHFNDFLDKALLKPTAQVYRFILPAYLRDRVRNVVNNADSPVILANDILQWKWKRAGNTISRFFINTTLGVGGIWDVATSFGIERHTEDFGQTLCVWGVGEGLYLYVPFVGPSSPRDLTGKVVDRFFDPLTYYADVIQQIDLSDGVTIRWNVDRAGMAQLALTGADLIDMRARNIETINEIERTSIDFYTAVRSLYRQSRDSACRDGKVDFEDLPDLSDEFE